METFYNEKSKYDNILNRVHKSISNNDKFFLIIKQYITNNICFYFISVIIRFFPLIVLTGNYHESFFDSSKKEYKSESDAKWIRKLSSHELIKILKIDEMKYSYISLIIFFLFIIRILIYLYIKNTLKKKKRNGKWPVPSKYQIIMDNIAFLLFPYIIEFLSLIYFMIFSPDSFIIKPKENNKKLLIIILILNTLLIIGYNGINYIFFICCNKIYSIDWNEAFESSNEDKFIYINNTIKYRYPKLVFYLILVLQNFILFQTIEIYINNKLVFKIIITSLLLLIFFFIFFLTIHKYNYSNIINIEINILIYYCFYSIIIDYFINFLNLIILDNSTGIIFILVKLLISFLSYICIKTKITTKFLINKINEVLFEEKNKKMNEKTLLNCLLYLNELMLKIKGENEVHSAYLLINIFTRHINSCNKISCNCKILKFYLQKELNEYKVKPGDKNAILDESKGHISDLLVILNYLYESIFIEYDYYNKFTLSILLAEHYCHLKNNPTMAFALITTLLMRKKGKFNLEQLVILYELSQKYIYYILAQEKNRLNKDINNQNNNLLTIKTKQIYFKTYFITLEIAFKIKKVICDYIDNEIKILNYKNIFEDTIEFKFDENNEEINKVNIKFFKEESNLNKDFSEKEMKKLRDLNSNFLSCYSNNNLFYIINLLKNEQNDYDKIINSIEAIKLFKGLPILLVFKYYLFFDIFEGGRIPLRIFNKLRMALANNISLSSNNITSSIYSILIKKLKKQNYMKNSKYYTIFEYKNELRIKYFNETYAIILGYKQKDLINEKIDVLMPKDFCKSHQNLIKRLLIYDQLKYTRNEKGFIFDSTGKIIYSLAVEGVMICELSKHLMFIEESCFIPDNEYIFMLNNNLQLLAHSKNFEKEYSLNYNIFQKFNLKLIDIFKIKPNKLYKTFSEVFNKIHYQKYLRQAKVEEYFTPQLFVPKGDKNLGMMNQNYFNVFKSNVLSKIMGNDNSNNNLDNNNTKDDEMDKLINTEQKQKVIDDIFFNPGQISFNSSFKFTLNKRNFVENLSKELSKIPDTDLMFEGDKVNYNLIMTSRCLIQKLILNKELTNSFLEIKVKLSYYYDKPFYFISVFDKKKLHLKINKSLLLFNNSMNSDSLLNFTKNSIKNQNKIMTIKNNFIKKHSISSIKNNNTSEKNNNNFEIKNLYANNNPLKSIKNDIFNYNKNEVNYEVYESIGTDKILEKMAKYRININNENFIKILKYILSIICICVLIIYILIMIYQANIIKLIHKTFQCYFYNLYTKNIILHFQTVIIEKFYTISKISPNDFTTDEDYLYSIKSGTPLLKESFHYFTILYYEYNLEINHDFDIMYKKRDFKKLEKFFEEILYLSEYPTEMDTLIYSIYNILDSTDTEEKILSDIQNFIFKKEINKNSNKKIQSSFIKLVYYFIINYDLTWTDIFEEIDDTIMENYRNYLDAKLKKYYALEIIGLSLIIIFFIICLIYLHFSNSIIIKNIIFLFIDFSDENYMVTRNSHTKMMILKLLEFKACITDFSLEKLKIYAYNLEKIHQNKNNSTFFNRTIIGINSIFEKMGSLKGDNKSIKENNSNKKTGKKIDETKVQKKESIKNLNKLVVKDEVSNSTNSSIQYLNKTSSTFLRDKLNNNNTSNLISNSNQSRITSNINTDKNSNISNQNNNTNNNKNNNSNLLYRKNKKDEQNIINNNENKSIHSLNESFHDIILNKSNKDDILLIKIFSIFIFVLLFLIIAYTIFKLINTISFFNIYENMFYAFNTITNRYSLLNYFYNALKSTILFPFDKQMKNLNNSLSIFEEANEKYEKINLDNLYEIKDLYDFIKDSRNNSTELMINKVCLKIEICNKYLRSSYNIMDTGIDFIFKSILIDISKSYLDYQTLKNKTNINDIKNIIINDKFVSNGLFIEYAYFYVKFDIFERFKRDEEKFQNKFTNIMGYLNIITVIFAIFSFLFVVVFIFISISIYAEPIKRSISRISCSFYYIKKYTIFNYRKSTTQ